MPEPSGTRTGQYHAVAASFLGWTLDAFDYFVVVFLVDTLAREFHVGKASIVLTLTATLAFRPVGALIFGLLSDRYGRRIPLMINVIFFSVVELLCGFSPGFTFFFVMRALYGIGMGGEWGVGASLAMEAAPRRWRGVLSGILQSGYSVGYLLAAIVTRFVLPTLGWRWMFWIGGAPALLALYIRMRVPESEAWKQHRPPSTVAVLRIVASEWKRFAYLVLLVTFMVFLSHGTQDLYPDFLRSAHGAATSTVSYIAMFYTVGMIVGAVIFGELSERAGRRIGMIVALSLSLVVIPLWAFGNSLLVLAIGAFLMQAGVQGAWGVIPVHLNEMSNDKTRGLVPGLAYQFGVLIAAPTSTIEYALRDHVGYQWALAGFEIFTILALTVIISLGSERRGRSFMEPAQVETALVPPG
jgi:SHS family lactate transporter-like MFS transporter